MTLYNFLTPCAADNMLPLTGSMVRGPESSTQLMMKLLSQLHLQILTAYKPVQKLILIVVRD